MGRGSGAPARERDGFSTIFGERRGAGSRAARERLQRERAHRPFTQGQEVALLALLDLDRVAERQFKPAGSLGPRRGWSNIGVSRGARQLGHDTTPGGLSRSLVGLHRRGFVMKTDDVGGLSLWSLSSEGRTSAEGLDALQKDS